MIWFLYFPIQLVIMLICYITNPIVCLFCNEQGELPRIFKMWQTWDDSCDPRFFVMEKVPKWLRYDYDKHYIEVVMHTPELDEVGRFRYGVFVKDYDFTLKERLQRYVCRVLWLTRNCSYGFSFWCFGVTVKGEDMVMTTLKEDGKGHFIHIGYDKSRPIWRRPWVIHKEWPIFGNVCTKHYLGWKIDFRSGGQKHQAMIANRLSLRFD